MALKKYHGWLVQKIFQVGAPPMLHCMPHSLPPGFRHTVWILCVRQSFSVPFVIEDWDGGMRQSQLRP